MTERPTTEGMMTERITKKGNTTKRLKRLNVYGQNI